MIAESGNFGDLGKTGAIVAGIARNKTAESTYDYANRLLAIGADKQPDLLSGGLDDAHRARLLSYHFTMVPSTIDTATGLVKGGLGDYGTPTSSTDYINIPENDQLKRLYAAVATAGSETNLTNTRCTQLQFTGEYLHAFEKLLRISISHS